MRWMVKTDTKGTGHMHTVVHNLQPHSTYISNQKKGQEEPKEKSLTKNCKAIETQRIISSRAERFFSWTSNNKNLTNTK